jgi:nucleoside-diphosphate-sugar epimerase
MVAVTGANGLLGSFIVRELIRKRIPFIALKRPESDTSLLADVAEEIHWRNADVLDPVQLEEAFSDVTKVIHAAAVVSYNPRLAKQVMDINSTGTRYVINEALARGVRRFVHISSVAALGRQKNQQVVDETNQWIDSPLHTVYAKSKYLAELEVFRAHEEGLSVAIVNPSVILAPADWNKSSARIFRYVWDEKKFYSDAVLNFVDARDVAEITVRLLENDSLNGERFVLNAGKIRLRELFAKIAVHFEKKPPDIKLNKLTLKTLARVEAFRSMLTGADPLITPETARLAGADFFYDNTKTKESLSFEFQPIDVTLDWCCRYYMRKKQAEN